MVEPNNASFVAALLANPILKLWLPLLLTALVLAGYDFLPRTTWWRRGYATLVLACIAGFGGLTGYRVWQNIRNPPMWDVQAFWIAGRVAVEGENFYDAADMRRIAEPLKHAATPVSSRTDFDDIILRVGFMYPPPTMLLVAPFGLLDLGMGTVAWFAFHTLVLLACIALLRRTFFPQGGVLELGVVTALVLLLHATYTTYIFGQTTFVVLLCLLLFWRHRERPVSGLALAAGVITKPVFAFFFAYPLVRRNWRALGLGFGALAVASALALALWGPEVFITYVTNNPVTRAADGVFTSIVNQSLLSTMIRAVGYDFSDGSPLFYPPFLAAAAFITGVTFWLVHKLGAQRGELGLSIAVPASLLIYPQALEHYTVLLLAPMLFLWRRCEELGVSRALVIALLTLQYALIRHDHGYIAVSANALQWVFGVVLGVRVAYGFSPRDDLQPTLAGGGSPWK